MPTLKAGCFLIDLKNKKIALVYREKHNDYSFPKGHLEANETLKQCAIRETEEETKRIPKVLDIEPNIENYTTMAGEQCQCHMYFALDAGASKNTSTDTHQTFWFDIDEVEGKISYGGLTEVWLEVKPIIKSILEQSF